MNSPTKPATSTTGIEDLPCEMISELFEFLQPKDLAACSIVNRRWHSIYAAFKVHRLVVIDSHLDSAYSPYFPNGIRKWYDSNQQIREKDHCHPAIFCRLAETPLLSNLKQLALCGYKPGFDLNELNRFSQLLHLEIDIDLGQVKVHLNLPKLKNLAFHYFHDDCPLSIDCQELSKLLYREGLNGSLEVKQPETIRMLQTNLVGPKLVPFKSVECLVSWQFQSINKATLLSLPKLRELRHIQDIDRLYYREFSNGPRPIDRMKRTLSEFLDEAKKLRGCDFQFICSGFRLSKVNVDQIDFGVQVGKERMCSDYVYMKNYQLIEPGALYFVDRVNYTSLLSGVTGEFPRCFSQKFTGIDCVIATAEVQDADQFLWFLKSLKCLKCLELEKTGLSQPFYDQLPASAHSLARLELRGDCKNELQLNFDFISEFPGLSHLIIEQPLSLSSLTSFVRSLGSWKEGSFKIRSDEFWIEKESGSPVWEICKLSSLRTLFKAKNPGMILKFFKRIKV